MEYDPKIWGPTYWFFLDNLAFNYPSHPNDIIKKKYYDFIQNLPIFIPHYKISLEFQELLDLYPIKSYLDDKKSLINWVNFIHNKINAKLEKPYVKLGDYYINHYKRYTGSRKTKKLKKYISYLVMISLLIFIAIYFNR